MVLKWGFVKDACLSPDGSLITVPASERMDAFGVTETGKYNVVNCWTSLVPATVENGCMLFIPGSHKLGFVAHEQTGHCAESEAGDARVNTGTYNTQVVQFLCSGDSKIKAEKCKRPFNVCVGDYATMRERMPLANYWFLLEIGHPSIFFL